MSSRVHKLTKGHNKYVVTSSQSDNGHNKNAIRTGMTDCPYVEADIQNPVQFGISVLGTVEENTYLRCCCTDPFSSSGSHRHALE
jgi:hypothetical protein